MIVSPYTQLAHHYRNVMEHVDYERWGEYLERVLRRHKRAPKTLLELGAGTGMLSEFFCPKSLEFRVTSDISYDMIARADRKFSDALAVVDASKIPFRKHFDLILMAYDAVNYLNEAQMKSFFSECARLLSPDGILLFDIATEYNILYFFNDVWDVVKENKAVIVRHSIYDKNSRIERNDFEFFCQRADGAYDRISERHEQIIYSKEEVLSMLSSSGLSAEALYADFTLSKNLQSATRIQFVCSLGGGK